MSTESKENAVAEVKGIAKYFRVSVKIELFGQTIFKWTWPPAD